MPLPVLDKLQAAILHRVGEVPESSSFYLTGGTALAHFYLRHRQSRDLDFFTATEELVDPFSRRLEEALRAAGLVVQRQRGVHSFVELLAQRGDEATIIHVAQDAAFRFEPTRAFPDYPHVQVDSLVDIASNKLLALYGRATLRDFIDVYALITKGHFTANVLVEKAKVKDPGFDLYWLGVAFERIKTFREDAPDLLLLLEPIPFPDLLAFFTRWRERIATSLGA